MIENIQSVRVWKYPEASTEICRNVWKPLTLDKIYESVRKCPEQPEIIYYTLALTKCETN